MLVRDKLMDKALDFQMEVERRLDESSGLILELEDAMALSDTVENPKPSHTQTVLKSETALQDASDARDLVDGLSKDLDTAIEDYERLVSEIEGLIDDGRVELDQLNYATGNVDDATLDLTDLLD